MSNIGPVGTPPKRLRLDVLLVRRGLFPSRERAQAAIMAARVLVDGVTETRAGHLVAADCRVDLRADEIPYVSRGGLKLEKALDAFAIDPSGEVALDVGASTGGFTDCLLQRGARRVYAVDVGYGQLAWKLRQDPRVVVIERTNARYLSRAQVPEAVDLASIDVSFISLEKVLPAVIGLLAPGGRVITLIKPQFEAGPEHVGKKGVVRDPVVHRAVLERVLAAAAALGLAPCGLTYSPVRGEEGNIEFLACWRTGAPATPPFPPAAVGMVVTEAHAALVTR